MLPPALAIIDLTVRYGTALAVDGLTLSVAAGEAFALLGSNGSGKSTTLAVAAGVREPTEGSVRAAGIDRRERPADYARAVGFVPQELALYDDLSAADNLTYFGGLYGLAGRSLRERAAEALDFAGLPAALARRRLRTLSGGQQRRAHLACALLHRPALLLLDEPTVGLDARSRAELLERLGRLRDDGRAVVLTTHRLDEAEVVCDRVGVLAAGRLVRVGPPGLVAADSTECVLEARSRDALDPAARLRLDRALGPGVRLRSAGRALRLEAAGAEELSRGLAAVLAEGVVFESLATPGPAAGRRAA